MGILPVHIEEVTAVAKLRASIPMEKLVPEEDATAYETEHSAGVVYRTKVPKSVALVFSSGKVVCTGAKSVRDAESAIRQVLDRIRDAGADVPDEPEIEIDKIVAAFRCRDRMDMDKVASSLEGSSYDPLRFPGIVYPMGDGVEFLIIPTGRIICTGARSIKDVQSSLKKLKSILSKAGIEIELV